MLQPGLIAILYHDSIVALRRTGPNARVQTLGESTLNMPLYGQTWCMGSPSRPITI
jgi:hypothetical protein